MSFGHTDPTHHVSLSDGSTTYGLIYSKDAQKLEMPLSPPAQAFDIQQRNWMSGRGFLRLQDDPNGFNDSQFLWTTTDGKTFPVPQWRFATGIRTVNEDLPDDNQNLGWWKLYGTADAANTVGRYLSRSFTSVVITADKAYLWIRRRGTPGALTFKLKANNGGDPAATTLQTVTKTVSDITDTISVYQLFDWTGAESLSATTYHITIEGASTDTSANHWEVLCNTDGTSSKMSSDGSTWSAAGVSMYYRITDVDTARKWWFFILENALYAVDTKDATSNSVILTNGVRGTATSGDANSLTNTNITMVADQYIGARIRIYDGTGDGQDREITDNDTTSFTVLPTVWDVAPDATSKYFVYATKVWTTVTGTPGIGKVIDQPATADKTAYLPQGLSVNARRMYVNASSHTFAAEGTYKLSILYFNVDPFGGNKIYGATPSTAGIYSASTVAQGSNLTFGTTQYVGSSDFRINKLFNYNGVLHIFKEDGPYLLNGNRIERLTSGFNDIASPDTGRAVVVQDQYMWWSWGNSIIRTLGKDSTDMLNWRAGYEGLPANRRGPCVAAVSAIGWTFFAIDGGASNYSSVLCWSGYGWHEVFRGWAAGVRIRNIFWQSCVNARGRLWIDINGEMVFIEFPLNAANPLKDTTLNYQHEGVLTTSTIDASDALLYKVFEDLKLLIDQGTIEVDYQTNANVGTSTWTVLNTASTSPMTDLALNLGAVLQIRFRLRFQVTATRTPTILSGWLTSGRMMQPKKYQWIKTFNFDTNQETLTNEADHNPQTLYAQLQTWAEQQTCLTMRTLEQSSDNKQVTISLPAKTTRYVDESEIGGAIQFAIMEV